MHCVLQKWLEVCSRKTGDPPVCELCQYQYIRHKKFVVSQTWEYNPNISSSQTLRLATGGCRASPARTGCCTPCSCSPSSWWSSALSPPSSRSNRQTPSPRSVTIMWAQHSDIIIPLQVGPDTELSSSELLTLTCGVFFFFSFFVAMYVEVKAEYTIYQVSDLCEEYIHRYSDTGDMLRHHHDSDPW